MRIVFLLLVMILISCSEEKKKVTVNEDIKQEVTSSSLNNVDLKLIDTLKKQKPTLSKKERSDKIVGIGVLSFNNKMDYYDYEDTLFVYDENDSSYLKFNYKNDFLSIESRNYSLHNVSLIRVNDTLKEKFSPKYFEIESGGIIEFYCLGRNETEYKVLINDSTQKYILNDDNFVFETWEEYLKTSIVVVNSEIRNEPNLEAEVIYKASYETNFIVEEINGEWIKVNCFGDCLPCEDNKDYLGWVRWKDGDSLLVKLGRSC